MLELKPPDFPIPEFGGGPHRKRCPIELKPKAIGYAQSVLEGGRRPGGTVGLTYVTSALGILDEATLASGIKNRSTCEKEVQAATAASGTGASHVLAHPLLSPPLVITPPAFWPGFVRTHSIAFIDTPLSHPLNLAGVFELSLSTNNDVSTPPRRHTPSVPHPLAAGLSCMVFITGDALNSTTTHNSTPGNHIFKC